MMSPKMATVDKGGMQYIADSVLHNLRTLQKILEWNTNHNIKFFRVTSELFPWMSRYNIRELPHIDEIESICKEIGNYCNLNNIRLSFHPGPFNVLCSPDENVVNKTIKELNDHSEIFNLMGFDPSHHNKVNIHVGGTYGDKESALQRWSKNYYRLQEHTRNRLTIENDDKINMYSVRDLMKLHKLCGKELPIVFDYFHHKFNTGNWSEKEALEAAISTWKNNIVPVTHYSESKREEYAKIISVIPTFKSEYKSINEIKQQSHSDMLEGPIDSYGHIIDVMLEAKQKEQALFGLQNAELRRKILYESI